MLQVVPIAVAVVKIVQPFLPYLAPVGVAVQEKLQEKMADVVAEAGWEKAKQLWEKITARFKGDGKLKAATDGVNQVAGLSEAIQQVAQDELVQVLATKLEESPNLAEELQKMMGGEQRLNEIVAGDEAVIARNVQKLKGSGTNRIQGGDKSKIIGNQQEIDL